MARRRNHQQTPAPQPRAVNDATAVALASAEALPAATVQTLTEFAQELGRLMARRELAARRDRRLGFGLRDIVFGATIMAAVSLLLYRLFG